MRKFDVTILGGGLAGATLAIQLKRTDPSISVVVIEKRKEEAPLATHKVGESTVELGTYYLRETLDLKDHLDTQQLPKHGLRFFFSPKHKEDISKRVELGPRAPLPVNSHQLDRGVLENFLVEHATALGVDVLYGTQVRDFELGEDGHHIHIGSKDAPETLQSKWVVDATGRREMLKRKLDLKKGIDHHINAAWFRVKGEIDIDDWSTNTSWKNHLNPGLRRLSTVHLMDEGYWVWFIPLGTGNTSVGIVADPRQHPFETFNKLDKAFEWLKENEPLAYRELRDKKEDVLDFKVLRDYSHHSDRIHGEDRWAITGEAGIFLDPLYSSGTDLIAINNTLITDLIKKDLDGEGIGLHREVYEKTFFSVIDSWIPVYTDKYPLMGSTQTMVAKIFWDWALYWAFTTLLFTNGGYTNLKVLKELFAAKNSVGRKVAELNKSVQKLFLDFKEHDQSDLTDEYVDPFDLEILCEFYKEFDQQFGTQELMEKVEENLGTLESFGAELFRKFEHKVNGTEEGIFVDPYTMDLENGKGFTRTSTTGFLAREERISKDVDALWFYKTPMVNEDGS